MIEILLISFILLSLLSLMCNIVLIWFIRKIIINVTESKRAEDLLFMHLNQFYDQIIDVFSSGINIDPEFVSLQKVTANFLNILDIYKTKLSFREVNEKIQEELEKETLDDSNEVIKD